MKAPFIIYADLDSLLEKISTSYNNPNESSTVKMNRHTPSDYSLFTHCFFDNIKNRLSYYRGQDCMKVFCKDLKEYAERITKCEKKEMIPLTDEEYESYIKQTFCYICKKIYFFNDEKVRHHCHFTGNYGGAAHNNCSMNYKISKNIAVVFHNGSNYDYHFIIKELAKEFEGQLECLGENTEKYITFSAPIKKHKLKFIDSFRFISASLSSLVNNFSDELHSDKCPECKACLDYMSVKDNLNCNKGHNKDFNKELINRFSSTCKFFQWKH